MDLVMLTIQQVANKLGLEVKPLSILIATFLLWDPKKPAIKLLVDPYETGRGQHFGFRVAPDHFHANLACFCCQFGNKEHLDSFCWDGIEGTVYAECTYVRELQGWIKKRPEKVAKVVFKDIWSNKPSEMAKIRDDLKHFNDYLYLYDQKTGLQSPFVK